MTTAPTRSDVIGLLAICIFLIIGFLWLERHI